MPRQLGADCQFSPYLYITQHNTQETQETQAAINTQPCLLYPHGITNWLERAGDDMRISHCVDASIALCIQSTGTWLSVFFLDGSLERRPTRRIQRRRRVRLLQAPRSAVF